MCAALVERIAACAQNKPLLWLDHFAYSGRLLAAGDIPWLDAAAFLAYYRKAQSLLRSGVAMLPLEGFFDAWLTAHPSLATDMAGKRRVGFALKTLLAAEGPRAVLSEIVKAVRDGSASTPVVVAIPSPRRWLAWAQARANDQVDFDQAGVTGDDVESAAVYVADFLRTFAESHVDGLLLDETPSCGVRPAEDRSRYRPVINVAKHYRWDVAIKSDSGSGAGDGPGIDVWITHDQTPERLTGLILGDAFWAGEAPPPLSGAGFYFARVPEDAVPERVLERLATLR